MPFDRHGKFYPKPFKPITGSLFDLIPPDHPDEEEPATDAERDWYNLVVNATARLLVFVVDQVRSNYVHRRGVAFAPRVVRRMHELAYHVAKLLDYELSRTQIAKLVTKTAKQVELVVYSTEIGERENWPMAALDSFTHTQATRVVHDAFWGRWPKVGTAPAADPT